jgi:hypothetical protein
MQNTKARAPSTLCNTKIMDIEKKLIHGGFKVLKMFCCVFSFGQSCHAFSLASSNLP